MEVQQRIEPWASITALLLLLLGRALPAPPFTDSTNDLSTTMSTTHYPEGPTKKSNVTSLESLAPHSLRTTLSRIHFEVVPDYDYDSGTNYEDEEPSESISTHAPASPCDYDRCRHLQVPCEELQKHKRCLCPGISGSNVRPDPPRLGEIQLSESTITLHWCAPSSAVDEYRVELHMDSISEASIEANLNSTNRLATLGGLQPDKSYVVCVIAVNQAGASEVSQAEWGPCRAIKTPGVQLQYVYVAIGIGAAVLIILVASGMVWYWHSRNKKSMLHSASVDVLEPAPAGVPNMSYRSESVEQL